MKAPAPARVNPVALPDYRIDVLEAGAIRIVAPRELVSMNAWNGHHWRLKDRITQEWQQVLHVCSATSRVPLDLSRRRRRVTVTRVAPSRRNFLLDDDNLSGAVKPLLDALKRAGLITNDSRKWIERPLPTQEVATDRRYWTLVTIEPLGEPLPEPRPRVKGIALPRGWCRAGRVVRA